MEISSEPFLVNNRSLKDGFMFELLLVKINRFRNRFIKFAPLPMVDEFLFLELAEYLNINPLKTERGPSLFSYLSPREVQDYLSYMKRNSNLDSKYDEQNNGNRANLFDSVVSFFIDKHGIIPENEIPSQYTLILPQKEEIVLNFRRDPHNISDINLLTF